MPLAVVELKKSPRRIDTSGHGRRWRRRHMSNTTKTCAKCDESKSRDAFYSSKRCRDGLEGTCRACRLARQKQRRADDPEHFRAIHLKRRLANPQHCRDLTNARRARQPGRKAALDRASRARRLARDPDAVRVVEYKWSEENPVAHRAMVKRYRESNRHKSHAHQAVFRALKSGALRRQPCEACGKGEAVAHHDSYDEARRLDVRWLCHDHHMAHHAAERDARHAG